MTLLTCPYCGKGFEHNGRGKPRKTCGSEGCKKANRRAYQRAYKQSEEYKAYQRAYHRAYRQTEEYKAAKRAYEQTEEYKAYRRARQQTEEYKAYRRAYEQTEEYKACRRERKRQIRNAATINEMFRIITQAQENRP